jgi:hypothetical protein
MMTRVTNKPALHGLKTEARCYIPERHAPHGRQDIVDIE